MVWLQAYVIRDREIYHIRQKMLKHISAQAFLYTIRLLIIFISQPFSRRLASFRLLVQGVFCFPLKS